MSSPPPMRDVADGPAAAGRTVHRSSRLAAFGRRARLVVESWPVRDVLWPFAVTRTALLVVGILASSLMIASPTPGAWNASALSALNVWARWDAGWYLDIAERGYSFRPGEQSNVAFAPAYPILMKAGAMALGRTDRVGLIVSGVAVSNVALLASLVFLFLLVRLDHDRATAARATLYLLVFPATLYLSAVYAESLFVAATVASFYFARRDRWLLAGALGALAAVTRPHGVLLVVPLLFEYLLQRRFHWRAIRPSILAIGLVPTAFGAWMLYLYQLTGSPVALFTSQAAWGREMVTPLEAFLRYLSRPLEVHGQSSLIDLSSAVAILALAGVSWRFLRPSYALLFTFFLLAIISTGTPNAMLRLSLPLFPLFVLLAVFGRHEWFDRAYVAGSAAIASLFMAMFSLWYRVV